MGNLPGNLLLIGGPTTHSQDEARSREHQFGCAHVPTTRGLYDLLQKGFAFAFRQQIQYQCRCIPRALWTARTARMTRCERPSPPFPTFLDVTSPFKLRSRRE